MISGFNSWKEFQDYEVEFFENYVEVLKESGLAGYYFENWEAVKFSIYEDTCETPVYEEFIYDLEEWLEEIYAKVKPLFVELLESYSKSKDAKHYEEYINNFFVEDNIVLLKK